MYKKLRRKDRKQLRSAAKLFIQIGRLLEHGYPLQTAVEFLSLHVDTSLKEQLSIVLQQLKEGHSVHESFQFLHLPHMFTSFLYFYENQGDIALGFIQAGTLLEKREQMKEELLKLLRYPLFLLWLCLLLLILMYYLVVPHFQSFFAFADRSPRLTIFVFSFIEHTPYMMMLIVCIFIAVFLYYIMKVKSLSSYEKVMRLLRLPLIHRYVRIIITYYFSLQLGRLLSVGMSLQQSLQLFTKQDYVPFFQQECVQMMHELQQGMSLGQIASERHYFNDELAFIIENGEKTGFLAVDLIHYSEILYKELDEQLLKVLRSLQPFFFLFVGGIIFMLFLATMLPLFQMIGSL